MHVKIVPVDNGWIVSCGGADAPATRVFSYDDMKPDGEIHAWAQVLCAVDDLLGPPTSRHSPARVYVRVEPGDKYEPPVDSREDHGNN